MFQFRFGNFLRVLIPFSLTQALGIYVAYKFMPLFSAAQPVNFRDISIQDYIPLAVFIAVFVFLIARFRRAGSLFFKIFLTLLVFSGVEAVSAIWLNPSASVLAGILGVILFWSVRNVIVHNLAMVVTIASLGAILGLSMVPISVVYILVIFSVYDIVAVYKTKHMIKLADAMIRSRAIFGFVIPETGGGIKGKISAVTPGQGFMILGSGDVIFPLLLAASLVRISIRHSAIVAIFAAAGLFLMHIIFINQKVRKPMAALPPIALMSIIGYLVASLI